MKKVVIRGIALVLLGVSGYYLGFNGSELARGDQEESQQIIRYTEEGRMYLGAWSEKWELAKAERIRLVEEEAQAEHVIVAK